MRSPLVDPTARHQNVCIGYRTTAPDSADCHRSVTAGQIVRRIIRALDCDVFSCRFHTTKDRTVQIPISAEEDVTDTADLLVRECRVSSQNRTHKSRSHLRRLKTHLRMRSSLWWPSISCVSWSRYATYRAQSESIQNARRQRVPFAEKFETFCAG